MLMTQKAGRGLEFKFTKFDGANIDAKGEFVGYASRFGNEDLGGDVVAKGAFAKSLAGKDARHVKLLYEHDVCQPVGYWTDLQEDGTGLMAKGKLLVDDVAKAREVHALMKAGVLDGLSIGYCVAPGGCRHEKGVRYLEEIDLKEVSVVLFPMNVEAVISDVKSQDDLPTERDFERWCTQDAASLGLNLTRSEVRQYLLPAYRILLKAKQDAGGGVAKSSPPDVDWSALADGLRRLNEAAQT
jgi:Escherichia/Staphylococcus phage prohead protease